MRAINEKNSFSVEIERFENGELEVGASEFTLHPDDLCDAPTEPGCYVAECVHKYYYWSGDMICPPEEGEEVEVTEYWRKDDE